MQKLSLLISSCLLAVPAIAGAEALDQVFADKGGLAADSQMGDAKVYYNGGTRLEFPDQGVDMKINVQLQPRFSYTALDTEDREKAGVDTEGLENSNSFDLRRARLIFSGNLLNGDVSYQLQNEMTGEGGDTLRNAWLQWNWDEDAAFRMGQFKVPFSRQELVSSATLQFVERSIANNFFAFGHNQGASVHGGMSGLNYHAGVFNGNSDGEGRNEPGVDTNVLGALMIDYSSDNFGARSIEGDLEYTDELAFTFGSSASYEERNNIGLDIEEFQYNGDIGLKVAGFSLQGEGYYQNLSLSGESGSADNVGFYVQSGFFVVPEEWELAGRFSMIDIDDDVAEAFDLIGDKVYEYTLGINRYYWGHSLKLQTGVTFEQTETISPDADDVVDVIYDLQLSGYF